MSDTIPEQFLNNVRKLTNNFQSTQIDEPQIRNLQSSIYFHYTAKNFGIKQKFLICTPKEVKNMGGILKNIKGTIIIV